MGGTTLQLIHAGKIMLSKYFICFQITKVEHTSKLCNHRCFGKNLYSPYLAQAGRCDPLKNK